jgi:hypothetical protein
VASTKPKEEVPVDDWLPRAKDETALAWTRRLRAMASGEAGYRGVSVAHLWSVAEDLDAPARMRAGAVFVLASTEGARERVRVLATQVVDPAFSKLLEAVAEEASVEQLAALLEETRSCCASATLVASARTRNRAPFCWEFGRAMQPTRNCLPPGRGSKLAASHIVTGGRPRRE